MAACGCRKAARRARAARAAAAHCRVRRAPRAECGEQRLRTYEDQLQMRSFYAETDLISAEVQAVGHDGLLQLHTRALK